MRAIDFVPTTESAGGDAARRLDRVELIDAPTPTAGPSEVLIAVAAAGINNLDLMQRRGQYPVPEGASPIPGVEVAGTIAAVGDGVDGWSVGDRVCALLAGGGYAEYVNVPAGQVLPVPRGVELVDAAGLPEAAATCWANLVMHGGAKPGDRVLVHGGTGGIGLFAVQLCAAMGITVYATVGTDDKRAIAASAGASATIDYRTESFATRIAELTDGAGVDVILDVVGGPYLADNVRALATGGRLVMIAVSGGAKGELFLPAIMAKRAWVTGTTLRSRSVAEKSEIIAQVRRHVWPHLESGAIAPNVTGRFALADAEAALEHFAQPGRVGKLVLVVGEESA